MTSKPMNTEEVTKMEWKEELREEFEAFCLNDDKDGLVDWLSAEGRQQVFNWFLSKLTLSESRVRGEERERIFGNIRLWFDSYQDRQLEFTTDKFIEYLQEGK